MSEQPGDRVEELFDQAVALPPERRAAFLEAACADDPTLRAEVEGLLACDADFAQTGGDGDILKSPVARAERGREVLAGAHGSPLGWRRARRCRGGLSRGSC